MIESFNPWLIFNQYSQSLNFRLVSFDARQSSVSMKQAAWLTAFWWGVATVCGIWIFTAGSPHQGINYATAFVVEKALSVDNLFVFLVIFTYFGLQIVPA
ncbi:MAG: hypothetical protein CM1200mP39_27750 [Dehalococcoidia bacterium]|nr:MAG: hypothetical protein CM1200mP39_27750 [Dehalococcoidia bacterium]